MQSNKRKILITLPSLKEDPGGVARYYNAVLPYLLKSNNFKIEIFEIGSTHGKNVFFHPVNDQLKFIRKIRGVKLDIVHVNPSLNFKSFVRDALFIFWAKRKKNKVIGFFHGWTTKFEKKINGILKIFFNLTYKKADVFIVLASEFKTKLLSLKIDRPIHLLTTAVEELLVENFSIEKKIKRIKTAKTTRLLFLSRLEKEKGIFETIDAFKLLLDKKYNITLSIAGDGSITKEVYGYIERLGLSNKIVMLGYVKGKEKIQIFTEHDIYCFPTYHGEGMPTSVLEAMAFGMPVITRPIGGIIDFFENGKMGYLCETIKPEEIADNIETIIGNKNRICEIALYNYDYAKKHFMASIVADKLLNIYLDTSHDNSCYNDKFDS
ncbi:MAG: glycosyltransferase family 1 protein [Deltaproteobacteria bacterium]|nr:MAG: glycosyltransferase family 1 protein [Deltaproteobacteria bacterium]